MPRFRTAIDAKRRREGARGDRHGARRPSAQQSLQRMIESLPPASVLRFVALRQRCFEMRDIASGVRGQAAGTSDSSESIRTPALDRLLFLFLKLLMSQAGLDRFLRSASEKELSARLEETKARLEAAQTGGDERTINSLQDSVADAELRLDNYRKSMKDSEFVAIELDRIETKIQALIEMGVSRQDAEALSHQVTAAAESMQQTEDAVNQLQHLTGLADSARRAAGDSRGRPRQSGDACPLSRSLSRRRLRLARRVYRGATSCPHGIRRGRSRSPICISRARRRCSFSTATRTTWFRSATSTRRVARVRDDSRVPRGAAVRPLGPGAALRPGPRVARVCRAQ